MGIITIAIFAFSGKSDSSKSSKTVPSSSLTSKESSQNNEITAEKDNFNPMDTSDATIESIVTYANYLDMYELIVNEYIANYEAAVKQYGVGDDSSYQTMKEEVTATLEQQKQQYGPMNAPIIGKEDLVQFLKDYRDELKTYTDNLANGN